MSRLLTPKAGVLLVVVVLLLATALVLRPTGGGTKTLTVHLPRAVSVYEGTEVRVLGVNVGRVTAVRPDGDSVEVELEYDEDVRLPKDAQAVVMQPTLVADRFIQLTPAWTKGDGVLASGADIPLPDTGVPVELDRIYSSLRTLSEALGPRGVNADGTLDRLLGSTAEALDGQGAAGNQMINDLSAAAATLGQNSNQLFATVEELARFTQTLATNDEVVRAFIRDLAGVSSQLSAERQELRDALRAVATSVGTVQAFVKDNRKLLVEDVERLTRTVKTIASEKDAVDQVLDSAAVSFGNLNVARNPSSNTISARFGFGQNVWDADGLLCALITNSSLPGASKDLACKIIETLLEPLEDQLPPIPPPAGKGASSAGTGPDAALGTARRPATSGSTPADEATTVQEQYADDPTGTGLADLLGGAS